MKSIELHGAACIPRVLRREESGFLMEHFDWIRLSPAKADDFMSENGAALEALADLLIHLSRKDPALEVVRPRLTRLSIRLDPYWLWPRHIPRWLRAKQWWFNRREQTMLKRLAPLIRQGHVNTRFSHGDLHSGNLMSAPSGDRIALIDFGLAGQRLPGLDLCMLCFNHPKPLQTWSWQPNLISRVWPVIQHDIRLPPEYLRAVLVLIAIRRLMRAIVQAAHDGFDQKTIRVSVPYLPADAPRPLYYVALCLDNLKLLLDDDRFSQWVVDTRLDSLLSLPKSPS